MRWVGWLSLLVLASCAAHATTARRTVDPEMMHVAHDWPAPGDAARPTRMATGVASFIEGNFDRWCYRGIDGAAYCFDFEYEVDDEHVLSGYPIHSSHPRSTQVADGYERYFISWSVIGWGVDGPAQRAGMWHETVRAPSWYEGYLRSPLLDAGRLEGIVRDHVLTTDGEVWKQEDDSFTELPELRGATAFAAGLDSRTVCALLDQQVVCSGPNNVGQAGQPSSRPGSTGLVHDVVRGLPPVVALDGGDAHFCALDVSDSLWCWGHNGYGQLGDGTFVNRAVPVRVAGLDGVRSFSTGPEHTCATTHEGTTFCWGQNRSGQIGAPASIVSPHAYRVDAQHAVEVATGRSSTCIRNEDGQMWCWGSVGSCVFRGFGHVMTCD